MRTVDFDSDDAPFQESQMINRSATVILLNDLSDRNANEIVRKAKIPLHSIEMAQTTLDNRVAPLTYSINQMQLKNCAK